MKKIKTIFLLLFVAVTTFLVSCTAVPENAVRDENGEPVTKTVKSDHGDHMHDEEVYLTTDTKEGRLKQAYYDSIKAVKEGKEKLLASHMLDYKPQQTEKARRYIGKLIFTPQMEPDLRKLNLTEGAIIWAWVGCECDEKVGKFKDTYSSIDSSSEHNGKEEINISGELLRKLMSYDAATLQHVFLKYSLHGGYRTADEIGFNYQDEIPLEKVTIYTLDKWNYNKLQNKDSTQHVAVAPNNATADTNKNQIVAASAEQSKSVLPKDTVKGPTTRRR